MKPVKLKFLIIFLASIFLSGCNEVEMYSQWTEPVTLDGSDDADWPENPQYFDEDSKVRVSIMNDDSSLYIRLLTGKQTGKLMFLRGGFTVWLDNTDGTGKQFGLQFPLPRKNQGRRSIPDHKSRNSMEEMLEDSQYSLAILNGPQKNRQTMSTSKAAEMGIYARLVMEQGALVYELKVPLTNSEDNKTIGVGFETVKIERPSGKGSSAGGGKGGGRGGGGKKMGGQGGGHGGGKPQPIEIWLKVHLAENASYK